MGIRENEIFAEVSSKVQLDPVAKLYSKPGLCRVWSSIARDIIADIPHNDASIVIQVLETELMPGFTHSFLKIIVNETDEYLADGTGVEGFPPFFGHIQEAPAHLRNSHLDPFLNDRR
jgi:hypothetical protein